METERIVWSEQVELPTVRAMKAKPVLKSYITKYRPKEDGYVFLHGVAIAWYRDRFFAAWAHNRCHENSPEEVVNYATSTDGIHWNGSRMLK